VIALRLAAWTAVIYVALMLSPLGWWLFLGGLFVLLETRLLLLAAAASPRPYDWSRDGH
jgi:hypothetical protein